MKRIKTKQGELKVVVFFMRLGFVLLIITCSFQCVAQQELEIEPAAYILKSIYFRGGSHYVDDFQFNELKHLLDSIPGLKDYSITVHSHTDNIGGAAYNEWLSQMRSESAIDKLLLLDFQLNQIEIKDFGQFNPVFDNSTWEGRYRNRRVDIIFWPVVM